MHNQTEDWLTNRKQTFLINTASDWALVTSGVLQGSVLVLILFKIVINDIDVGLNNLIAKFADDTQMRNSMISDHDKQNLQEELHNISALFERQRDAF